MSSDEFIVDGRDVRTLPMAQRVKLWADTGANMLDRQPDITDEYSDFVRMFEERLDPITRASYLDHFEDAAQYREEMHQLYKDDLKNGSLNPRGIDEDALKKI